MKGRTKLRVLLLIALSAAGLGQNEDAPYFSLASNRTFGSNGKPQVALTAWKVDALEFRVYRINDPIQFFQQLEDPHQFGGSAPRAPHERTWLERIHGWKHGLRTSIRRSLRAQFTEPPSAHFGGSAPTPTKAGTKETRFAEAPVLNSQQLVLSFVQPVRSHARWESETVDLPISERGFYLIEAVTGQLRAYTLVMVSDIVLVTKSARGRILNFVADRNTGEPVRGAQLWVVTKEGRKSGPETDGDGIAQIDWTGAHPDDSRILARRGADFAVNQLSSFASADSQPWLGYVYTDRPVYRPGHTVHFKGILRVRTATGYDVPAAKQVSIRIHDSEDKPVYQKDLTTSAIGTVHDDFELPAAAALGNYNIEVRAGGSYMNGNFDVEEYKKPEYEVRVTTAKPRVLEGQSVESTIDSAYYFGEPVAGAKVKYAVYRNLYYFPLWYDADETESQGDADNQDTDSYGDEQILEENGVLDSNGKLTIHFDTGVSEHRNDYRYRIEARVTDEANREITGLGWAVATYGSFLVNVTPDRYFYPPGGKAVFKVQARDYDNHPVTARVRVELLRFNRRDPANPQLVSAADGVTGSGGDRDVEITLPAEGGYYHARVTSRTPEGRDVQNTTSLWISGRNLFDFGDDRKTVDIVPDKKIYRPGDTAKVLIVTGKPNTPVLATVEGRDLRLHKLLRSSDSTAVLEVPIAITDEPGLFVSVEFLRGGNLFQGTKYIKVPPEDHQLNVKLATDKPQYTPGETAQYSIQATGADGQPAARAELSLGVVDEAIYGIRRDTLQDPLSFFFGREWNSVYTERSLNYYFNGEAGKRTMKLALGPHRRLAQLKPDHLVQPKTRKVFPDTALWLADLTTDAGGRAQTKVEFPDSLTTWRATARGVTPDTKVGAAVLKTIVRKNLILRLAVPRFFVQGDEVTISALVHNYLTTAKTARVSLDVAGLDVLDGKTRDVEVPSRGEVKLDWRVRAQAVRSAMLTGKALTNEESDALELQLPVNVPGVKLAQSRGGSLAPGGSAEFDLTYSGKVEPGSRSLSVRVSPSIAGSLFGALDYLITFPYGCVEQTMSSFLPNIIVSQAVRDLGVKTNVDEAALQSKIRAGIERLYTFQHEDGGWGWWQTDESHPFMTAYVVAGLTQAAAAGVQVDNERVQKGADWVKKEFARDPKLVADLRAYMAYAVVDAGLTGQVYDQRAKLSPYGLALLGLGLEQLKDARASEIAALVEQAAQQDEQQAWWPATRDPMLDFSDEVTPESTAYVVKFLSHQRAGSPLLPKAALWLMNHRNEGYWWSSTKQTAMVIYGLTDYLKTSNELNENLTATVYVNGQAVLTKKLDQATGISAPEITLDESKLQPGANHVRVTMAGEGRLYYSARAEYFSRDEKLQQTGSASLNILRDYFKLAPMKQGETIVYDTVPLNGPVAVGDILAVRLTVTGAAWKYLMVEDPIPAGTEFIERDGSYQLKSRPPWWSYYFTRRELHDDRMAMFQTWFPQGQHQYFYLLKVVNPGVFQVSPARVQPMYQPGFLSTTESLRLEVK
jgi:uncharacterized protein YfaS (alpha-2-macroglobulin family)